MSDQTRERRRIRTYHELDGADRSGLASQVGSQRQQVTARLASVRSVVAVMSGKGGVGKSFVTAGLASALARRGQKVGVLDGDLNGPTAARMLGASGGRLVVGEDGVDPAVTASGVRVISSDLLLDDGAPLRWRGPDGGRPLWRGALETGMLREFLAHVRWGALDVLLVDLPPGTGRLDDLVALVPDLGGVVVVTIPSEASRRAVHRAVAAARGAHVPILGIVENMSGYRCEGCRATRPLFEGDAGDLLAREANAPVLARLPFDPRLHALDGGDTRLASDTLAGVAQGLLARLGSP
jgi:ATP-binding protein involved in chromosome partitioning